MSKNMLEGFNANAVSFANDIDTAMMIHVVLSTLLFLSVVVPMFWFAWKYRSDKVKDEEIGTLTHHTGLEITWTVIPVIIVMIFFYYGNETMKQMRTMPAEAESLVVKVEGKKWLWNYKYPANSSGFVHEISSTYDQDTGKVKRGLYVPKGKNVILEMTAPLDDVIHAYYIPAFRTKEDVVPGRTTKLWFKADKTGTFDVQCAEYCGTMHSYMYSTIVVMEPAEYEAWFESKAMSPGEDENVVISKGQQLFEGNCAGCHSYGTDTTLVGPGLKGIGAKYDTQYLKDALTDPDKDIPSGFVGGMMPSYKGMSASDIEELVKYMQSSK